MSKRSVLMEKCGLPDTYETSHCFNDSTHQTCCHLGPEARKYADNSGNPIGKASLKAFYDKNNRHAENDELTPWCTCFGSKVCSYYADKFNDGTHIEFLNDMKTNDVLKSKAMDKFKEYTFGKYNHVDIDYERNLAPLYGF